MAGRPVLGHDAGQRRRRHPIQSAVRPTVIVIQPPAISNIPRLREAQEQLAVQALAPQCAVERLDVPVLPRGAPLLEPIAARYRDLDIRRSFRGDAARFGLTVRASPDGKTGVPVWFSVRTGEFGLAGKRMAAGLEAAKVVRMHVFVDRSVTEVYLHGNVVTKVAYLDPSARTVHAFAEGGACTLESVEVWQMNSMWE